LAEGMTVETLLQYQLQSQSGQKIGSPQQDFPFHSDTVRPGDIDTLLQMVLSRAVGKSLEQIIKEQDNWPDFSLSRSSPSLRYDKEWSPTQRNPSMNSIMPEDLCDILVDYTKGAFSLPFQARYLEQLGFVSRKLAQTPLFHFVESKEGQRLSLAWFPEQELCVSMIVNGINTDVSSQEEMIWSHLLHDNVAISQPLRAHISPEPGWEGEYTSTYPIRLQIRIADEQLYAAFDEHPFVPLSFIEETFDTRLSSISSPKYVHFASGLELQFLVQGAIPMLLLKTSTEEISFWQSPQ